LGDSGISKAQDKVLDGNNSLTEFIGKINTAVNASGFVENHLGSAASASASGGEIAAVLVPLGVILAAMIILIAINFGMAGLIVSIPLAISAAKIMGGMYDLLANPDAHPIMSLAIVGYGLMDFGLYCWVIGGIALFGIGAAASIGACMNPIPYALQMMLTWIMPIMTFILVSMMSTGAVLLLYVPIIPFMIFTFAAIGWFFSVIEAMVAAPLVALGLVHPEGHDVFGKGESALMLTLNVFLRPVMLIIAFVIATMLSYVGIWLLNKAYWAAFLHDLLLSGDAKYAAAAVGPAWIFAFPMMITVYGSLVIMMLQKIFGYMPKLADEVLIWIGGPSRGFGSEAAAGTEQIKGEVAGAAKGMAEAGAQGTKDATKFKQDTGGKPQDKTEVGGEGGDSIQSVGKDAGKGGSASGEQEGSSSSTPSSLVSGKESSSSSSASAKGKSGWGSTDYKSQKGNESGYKGGYGKVSGGSSDIKPIKDKKPKTNDEEKD